MDERMKREQSDHPRAGFSDVDATDDALRYVRMLDTQSALLFKQRYKQLT